MDAQLYVYVSVRSRARGSEPENAMIA